MYLDESGDLGFAQGSSRYFTIAFAIVKNPAHFKRCVRKTKTKFKIPHDAELKGSRTEEQIKKDFLLKVSKLDVEIHAITVDKKNVQSKLRSDTNILYNYMVGLLLVDYILSQPIGTKVVVTVDKRVISITSGFKFNEYLKYKIWYENVRTDIDLDIHHEDSMRNQALQGIDVICNSIFRKYSSGNSGLLNILRNKIKIDKRLFFDK